MNYHFYVSIVCRVWPDNERWSGKLGHYDKTSAALVDSKALEESHLWCCLCTEVWAILVKSILTCYADHAVKRKIRYRNSNAIKVQATVRCCYAMKKHRPRLVCHTHFNIQLSNITFCYFEIIDILGYYNWRPCMIEHKS